MAKKKRRSRGPRRAGGLAGSAQRSIVGAGIGAAGYYGQKVAQENIEMLRENWWALPAATLGVAAFVGTRRGKLAKQISTSLATVAGYTAIMAYDLNKAGEDVGAVFEPRRRAPQVSYEPAMPQLPAPVETAAVYPPTGPMNAFRRGGDAMRLGRRL